MRKYCQALFSFALLAAVCARADGGAILARQTVNGLGLTVFASPAPLRAGPVDVSVLVQDGEAPVLDAAVEVTWQASSSSSDWLPPCCTMESGAARVPAVRAHSNNKFLYSAIVPMRSSGPSEIVVKVTQGGREALLSCDVEVEAPLPPALAFWPWLVLPPVAIAGFALHQNLVKSRQKAD
ncbi:MAG TPA: hypothetical protein VIS96_01065 [Terrimicrobiaceae bacterium]